MAQVVTRTFIDDIDGTEAERTFAYTVDGIDYEIDLSTENIKEFNEAIAGFVESSRKAPRSAGRKARVVGAKPGANREHLAAVRSWLRQQGHQVQDRGRIAADLMAKFDAAHASSAVPESQPAWA